MQNNRLLKVLRIRPFFFLWVAEIFSQIAVNMLNFVLITVIFELTASNTAVSGIVLSFTIPAIIFGVLAGVYVDRRDKQKVLIVTNLLRAIFLLFLAFSHNDIFIIYLLTFLITTVTQFFIPAETPIIPFVVKKELLLSANALFGVGLYGSMLVAYGLSGPFLIFFKETYTFLTLALFFGLAGFFAALIKIPEKEKLYDSLDKEKFNIAFKDEMSGFFSIISKTKEIYQALFLLTFSQVIVLLLAVIGPGYAREILKINVNEFPLYFITPAALGTFLGAIFIGSFLHNRPKSQLCDIGIFFSGLSILLLPFGSKVASRDFVLNINQYLPPIFTIDILHFMIFLAFVLGFANALIFVPSNTILQERTSQSFRGKVYGSLNALVGLFSLFPIILVGRLADIIGVAGVLSGIGVTILGLSIIRILFFVKKVKII